MSVKNTAENYGLIAIWLHWVTALLFLGAYCTVYYRHWFTEARTPESLVALQLHTSFGVSVGVVVVLRIIWRIMNRQPDPEPGTRVEHLAAHLGHYALYAVMIIMPLTGYLGTGVNSNVFFLFEVTKFEDTPFFTFLAERFPGLTFKEFEKPIDFIHKDIFGAWVTWLLIVGHVGAALYHHFVKKDRTIYKMTGRNEPAL